MHEGRHFRILYILLNNERVTAPELAEEFGIPADMVELAN